MEDYKLLSFDIGRTNLAYCIGDKKQIYAWDLVNLGKGRIHEILPAFIESIHDNPNLRDYDSVVIEQQIEFCSAMFGIMLAIQSAFLMKHKILNEVDRHGKPKKVIIISPKLKLQVYKGDRPLKESKSKKKHTVNKSVAKQHALFLLEILKLPKWIAFYKKQKKKDDFADSLLQLHAVLNNLTSPPVSKSAPKVISNEPESADASAEEALSDIQSCSSDTDDDYM